MSEAVTFENVFLGSSPQAGKLRINASGYGFKSYNEDSGDPTLWPGGELKSAAWLRVARNFQLRLTAKDKSRVTFDGFRRDDLDKIKKTLQNCFGVGVESRDPTLKGFNWGKMDVQGPDLAFHVQGKTAFELPLEKVLNSNIAGKNEVAIEFNPPAASTSAEGRSARQPDELVEMRFYIPGTSRKKASDAGSDADSETENDEEGNAISAAEAMHNLIKERADIGAVVGKSICLFEEVLVLTPRGRYSLEFFADSLRLVGKSTDYRIPFSSIQRIFLLPKVDDIHIQLVLNLDPPIRQGATRYPFLVAQWPKDEETDVTIELNDEDKQRFPELQEHYDAPTFQVISRVLKSLTGKKVTPPGGFRNAQGLNGIKANVKAVQGELYFLEKGLIFIAKQPIHIEFSKTESISFSRDQLRVGGGVTSARTFDMRVASRVETTNVIFSSISKEEVAPISTFLQSKNVRLTNEMDEMLVDVDPIDDSEDDEEMSIDSDENTGRKKERVSKPSRDDDDESEDEDFQEEEESDEGSPSETDSQAGSDEESDASDQMMEELAQKSKAKKARKSNGKAAKKEQVEDEDAEEGSEEDGKPKKKKAKKSED